MKYACFLNPSLRKGNSRKEFYGLYLSRIFQVIPNKWNNKYGIIGIINYNFDRMTLRATNNHILYIVNGVLKALVEWPLFTNLKVQVPLSNIDKNGNKYYSIIAVPTKLAHLPNTFQINIVVNVSTNCDWSKHSRYIFVKCSIRMINTWIFCYQFCY